MIRFNRSLHLSYSSVASTLSSMFLQGQTMSNNAVGISGTEVDEKEQLSGSVYNVPDKLKTDLK